MRIVLATEFDVESTTDEDEAIEIASGMIQDQLNLGMFGELSWEVKPDPQDLYYNEK